MPRRNTTEDELREYEARVLKSAKRSHSLDGVKKHTGVRAGGGGAASERRRVDTAGQGIHVGTKVKSSARTPRASNPYLPYKNKLEAAYAAKLDLEKSAGFIRAYWYEPMSIWLPGKVRYTPDFLVEYVGDPRPKLAFHECKGWSKNIRDGMARFRVSSGFYSCFAWCLVKRDGHNWHYTEF